MKWLTTLLGKWFFGNKGGTIRIDPDHLPGLRAPKPKPRFPIEYPRPQTPPGTDIETIYWRFYKSRIGKPFVRKTNKKGNVDFK
jgi:hypothetical protein